MEAKSSQQDILKSIYTRPNKSLQIMMTLSINVANLVFELCKERGCTDSQEFINWQDELNALSIKY